jgi:hypothetical protein
LVPAFGTTGVTANDVLDVDTGPNKLQTYPVLTSVTTFGSQTTIRGTLNSNRFFSFNIQFFSSPAADPSGFGEGKTYVGQTNVDLNAEGNASFTFTTNTPISGGHVVTATATDTVFSNTSEFSEKLTVEDNNTPPPPPAPQCSDGADNDMDGKTDFGGTNGDPGCESATANSESPDPNPSGDTTKPTIELRTPADNATYKLNDKLDAKYTCADEKGGSGLMSCIGDVASGSPIDTSQEGTKTFTVTAKDYAGNTNTVTHTYSVTRKLK